MKIYLPLATYEKVALIIIYIPIMTIQIEVAPRWNGFCILYYVGKDVDITSDKIILIVTTLLMYDG